MKKVITTNELYEAINAFSESMDRQFQEMRSTFATKEDLQQEIDRVVSVFSPMVYKEDRKVNALMERLVAKRVLARSDVSDLLDTHPLVS